MKAVNIPSLSLFCLLLVQTTSAEEEPTRGEKRHPVSVSPTLSNVPYEDDHERQVLDFYQAESEEPAPLLFFIHGGAWNHGSKEEIHKSLASMGGPTDQDLVNSLLNSGISVVAINYRYINTARELGIVPPVIAPLHDAARALQYVRHMSREWNIDPNRIMVAGGSAGGASSLWLGLHDDLANSESPDPVERKSSRPNYVATLGAQTSLDPREVFSWIPNTNGYGGHAFGVNPDRERGLDRREVYQADREKFLPWIKVYSPMELISKDDAAGFFIYYRDKPALGKEAGDPTHTANYGVKFYEKCLEKKVSCEFVHGGNKELYKNLFDHILTTLSD